MERIIKNNLDLSLSGDYKDYECPICLMILVEPVKVTCGHIFCNFCLDELMMNSTDESEFKCPMCRHSINKDVNLQIDKNLDILIKERFTKDYNTRAKAIEDIKRALGDFQTIRILYGNTHELVSEPKSSNSMPQYKNKHKWCAYVNMDNDKYKLIDSVTFELHPTFNPNTVTLDCPPFKISRLGWGTFEIQIKINWNKKLVSVEPTKIAHHLSFEDNGIRKVSLIRLKLNSE